MVGLNKNKGAMHVRLNELSERDFEVLREPLVSGRQSPGSLGAIFILAVFLQALFIFFIFLNTGVESNFPYKHHVFWGSLIYMGFVTLLSVLYAFKFMWSRYESFQYLLSIIVSQNLFGISMYILAILLVSHNDNTSTTSLMLFTFITLLIGILVLYFTYQRFIKLLENGAYRQGSKKAKIRAGVEKEVASHQSTIIVLSVGLVFILQFLFRHTVFSDFEDAFLIILGLGLFYTVLFVLPEQLVIYYCKRRFKSFRFDENGNLNPLEYKQHRNDAELSKKRRKQMR